MPQETEGFEPVHTMVDYYDGAVAGVANFGGRQHVYRRLFDAGADEYSNTYLLRPIDEATFALAQEDWVIWQRWERTFQAGKTTIGTHPALPEDRERHAALSAALAGRLEVTEANATMQAMGEFRRAANTGADLVVRWAVAGPETA